MNIAHWLHDAARQYPDHPALFQGIRLHANYWQFATRAAALGRWLGNMGVGQGDRVALFMKNRVEYLELFYACWWIGAVALPINAKLHPKELAWILDNAEAHLLFTDTPDDVPPECVPSGCQHRAVDEPAYAAAATAQEAVLPAPITLAGDVLAWLFYTSGTTGRPKGVMLSHHNLLMCSLAYAAEVETVKSSDSMLYAAPLSHGAGMYHFMYVRRAARHVVPASRGFDATEILDTASACGSLSLFAAPTMVKRLADEARSTGRNGEGLHTIIYGGAPMYEADIREALETLGQQRFVQIYGQGESPMTITVLSRSMIADAHHPRWRERIASVGVAQCCVQVRVVDANMNDVPTGHDGEVVARGGTVMLGYWRNATASHETLVDGWLRTGDIGRLNEEGFLTLTDRAKDVIISGGSNIYPREVEEVLMRHPCVHETAVVGEYSPQWGEQVVAFVVLKEGTAATDKDLDTWCRNEIAAFKAPKRYIFRTELPKTSYGKIPKTVLRDALQIEETHS